MNSRFHKVLTSVATLVIMTAGISSLVQAQQKRVIPGSVPGLPFSDGVVVGNTLYVAGQQGTDANGKLREGGIVPETQATLENIEKTVKAAGFQLKDIVAVTVYLADIKDFAEMNKVYKSFIPDPKPARTTIQAAALVNNARVEITVVAAK